MCSTKIFQFCEAEVVICADWKRTVAHILQILNITHNSVWSQTEPTKNEGYLAYKKTWFSSFRLYDCGHPTLTAGTVMSNRKEMPKQHFS